MIDLNYLLVKVISLFWDSSAWVNFFINLYMMIFVKDLHFLTVFVLSHGKKREKISQFIYELANSSLAFLEMGSEINPFTISFTEISSQKTYSCQDCYLPRETSLPYLHSSINNQLCPVPHSYPHYNLFWGLWIY